MSDTDRPAVDPNPDDTTTPTTVPPTGGPPVPDPPGKVLRLDRDIDDEQRRSMRRDVARARWRMTVPEEFEDAMTTRMHPTVMAWADEVMAHAADTPRGLVTGAPSLLLVGNVGTGKTHAGWWSIGHFARAGILTSWEVVTAADLHAELTASYADAMARFERYANTQLLMLDDAAMADPTPGGLKIDYRLFNHRYNHRLPVIVTTNLPPRRTDDTPKGMLTMEDRMDERVLSRLTKMVQSPATGRSYVVNLGTRDRRRFPDAEAEGRTA